jgi:hypothetical protein
MSYSSPTFRGAYGFHLHGRTANQQPQLSSNCPHPALVYFWTMNTKEASSPKCRRTTIELHGVASQNTAFSKRISSNTTQLHTSQHSHSSLGTEHVPYSCTTQSEAFSFSIFVRTATNRQKIIINVFSLHSTRWMASVIASPSLL